MLAAVLVLISLGGSIALFSWLAARRIYKLEAIDAIRGVEGKTGAGQNVLLFAVSFGIMVLLSFAATLLYNVSIVPENFIQTLSEESPSVIFKVNPDLPESESDSSRIDQLQAVLEKDDQVESVLVYGSAPISYEDGSLMAFVTPDFDLVTNDICYEGQNPQNKNEVAIGSALASDYAIGDTIQLNNGDVHADYTVCGYIQSVNNQGLVVELTQEGFERIDGTLSTLNVYLKEEGAADFITQYEKDHDDLIASSTNYEQLSKTSQQLYTGVVSAIAVALFMISIFMVLLVLYVLIHSLIVRRRQEFGIYKAVGYTSSQLTWMTAGSFVPVIGISSLLAAVLGLWYMPAINNSIFSMIGAMKNHFEVSLWMLIGFGILFTLVAFLISFLLARPIKKITVYSLLKD